MLAGARPLLEEVVRLADAQAELDRPGLLHLGLGLVPFAAEDEREAALDRTEIMRESQVAPVHDAIVASCVALDLAVVPPARGDRTNAEGPVATLAEAEHETCRTTQVPADAVRTTTDTAGDLEPRSLGADREDRTDHPVGSRALVAGDHVRLGEGAEGEPAELEAPARVGGGGVNPAIRELHLVGAAVVVEEVVVDLPEVWARVDVVADAVAVLIDVVDQRRLVRRLGLDDHRLVDEALAGTGLRHRLVGVRRVGVEELDGDDRPGHARPAVAGLGLRGGRDLLLTVGLRRLGNGDRGDGHEGREGDVREQVPHD